MLKECSTWCNCIKQIQPKKSLYLMQKRGKESIELWITVKIILV